MKIIAAALAALLVSLVGDVVRVGKNIHLEDKDGARPYIKRWKKIKMGHCNKLEDGKR